MATGSIRERKTKNGKTHYEIILEHGVNPLTGKRVREFQTVKGSMREAKALLHSMISEAEKGKLHNQSKIKLGAWMDEWMELYLPNIEETTRVGYKTKINCYIKPALGDVLLKSLRTEHIQRLVNDMLENDLSPKSIREVYNNINAALKKAVLLRMIQYNPCEGVVLPKLKRYKAKVYDIKKIHDLLDIAQGTDMYLPILLCVTAGLRRGELLALRWQDIDFEKNMLSVRKNMVRGEKSYVIKAPKTEAGIRDITLGEEVMQELHKAKVQYFKDKMQYGGLFQDLNLVVRQPDGSPLFPDSMTRKWKRFIHGTGLEEIRLHDLRHSNATALIQAGVNPRVVQQRLGHSDVNTTLSIYTHVLPEMDKEAAQKIDDIMLKKA